MVANSHFDTLSAILANRSRLSRASVIVPNAFFGEAMTRWFALSLKKPELLFGVKIIPIQNLVTELLPLTPDWKFQKVSDFQSLQLKLWALIRHGKLPKLDYFELNQLQEGPGYADAFAQAILELDLAGLTPAALTQASKSVPESYRDRVRDIAAIWEAAILPSQLLPGQAISIFQSGLSNKETAKSVANYFGSLFFMTTGFEPAVTKNLIETLVSAVNGSSSTPISQVEKFSDALARVENKDGLFEEWASAESESCATVRWLHQVLSKTPHPAGPTPDIAILAPADRVTPWIDTLSYELGDSLFYSPQGRRALDTAEGQRILAVLEALQDNLSCETMIRVLPWLRKSGSETPSPEQAQAKPASPPPNEQRDHQSDPAEIPATRDQWIEVIHATGTLGGNLADASGLDAWCGKLQALWPGTEPYREALSLAVAASKKISTNAPLADVAAAVFAFLDQVRLPHQDSSLSACLRQAITQITLEDLAEIRGYDALEVIGRLLDGLTLRQGDLAKARIFVGTPDQAQGTPFSAIRMVGLTEGAFPSSPREDAILPDELRKTLPGSLKLSRERVLRQRFSLRSVLAFLPRLFSASCANQDIAGRERAHSALYLDLLADLPREEPLGDELQFRLHDTRERHIGRTHKAPVLRREYLSALRLLGLDKGNYQPVPEEWALFKNAAPAFDFIEAYRQEQSRLDSSKLSSHDVANLSGDDYAGPKFIRGLPGIAAEFPLHPSAMGKILDCPYRFYLESVLGWQEPSRIQDRGTIGATDRGTIIHWIAEQIYRKHTPAEIMAMKDKERDGFAKKWVERAFKEHPITNFLATRETLQTQIDSVSKAVTQIIKTDQERKLQKVTPEQKVAATLKLTRNRELHIKGTADRLEVTSAKEKNTRIVDFKSGRGKTEAALMPSYDIQIVAYFLSLVAMKEVKKDEIEALEFRFPENRAHPSRIYKGVDLQNLLKESASWLSLIRDVLDARLFIRTTDPNKCRYCPFNNSCGDDRHELISEKIDESGSSLAKRLKAFWQEQLND